mmetsp:Transcript_87413/g.232909  ORF Transcript_87413/g.232909 Transcript_87413/m.232909 type:complete len:132 (+) Transcript_87413:545-940(+)
MLISKLRWMYYINPSSLRPIDLAREMEEKYQVVIDNGISRAIHRVDKSNISSQYRLVSKQQYIFYFLAFARLRLLSISISRPTAKLCRSLYSRRSCRSGLGSPFVILNPKIRFPCLSVDMHSEPIRSHGWS